MRIGTTCVVLSAIAAAWGQPAQVDPEGGKWKTWVLSSGSQFRPAAPPDAGATQGELAWLRFAQSGLSDGARSQVAYWDQGSASYHWVQWLEEHIARLGVNTPNATRQMAALNVAIYDAMVAAWDAKYAYKRPLPAQVDPAFRPLVDAPAVPSYPNEFAVAAGAAAAVLSYFYPSESQSIQALAEEAGRSRLYAGVAFPSDYFAGLALGGQIGQLVVPRAKSDGFRRGLDRLCSGRTGSVDRHESGLPALRNMEDLDSD